MYKRGSARNTLALGALVTVGFATAGAAPASGGEHETTALDVNVSADTVVTGVVTKDGKPVAGADVLLIAWPNDAVLDALADGERVNTRVVARDAANDAGQFEVSLTPDSLSPEHRRKDGGVQLELVIADRQSEVIWNFTAVGAASELSRNGALTWGNERVDQRSLAARSELGVGPTHISVEIGERPTVRELGDEPENWVDDNGGRLSAAGATDRAVAPKEPRRADFDTIATVDGDVTPLAQGWCATGTYETGRTESFIRTIGVIQAKNWVDQSSSSSHTLGIAYKSGSGAWSQSGTASRTTSTSSSDHLSYNGTLRNKVNYRKYVGCDGTPLNAEQWRSSSIHSLGSSVIIHSTRPDWQKSANCTNYPATTGTKSKTSGSNVTYSAGVNFSKISLSARASYSSYTKQRWVPSGGSGRFNLCGSSSSGWSGAAQAGAFVYP